MVGLTQVAAVTERRSVATIRLPHRAGLVIALLSVFVVLGGCSATRFAYNQLDWVIVWYIDDYFELNAEQREALSTSVRNNLAWHRQSELPRYAEFCRRAEAQWVQRESVDTLEQNYDELVTYWDAIFERVMPDIAQFLLSLNDEQIDHFVAKMEKNNEEMIEEYSGETHDRRLRQRHKAIFKMTERFVGRLSGEQRAVIRQYANDLHDNSQEWMEGRRRWQQQFTSLLRDPPDDFETQLRDIMLNPNQFDAAEYRQKVEQNKQLMFDLYEVLLTNLSDRQRDTLSRRLNRYARSFELLSADRA